MSEVSGVVDRLQLSISPGYGFTAPSWPTLPSSTRTASSCSSILCALILAGRDSSRPDGHDPGDFATSAIASEVVLEDRDPLRSGGVPEDWKIILAAGIATGTN